MQLEENLPWTAQSADSYPSAAQFRMRWVWQRVARQGGGTDAELCGMVSMAMQALPDLLLFPLPLLKSPLFQPKRT